MNDQVKKTGILATIIAAMGLGAREAGPTLRQFFRRGERPAIELAENKVLSKLLSSSAAREAEKGAAWRLENLFAKPAAKEVEKDAAKGLERWWAKPGTKTLEEQAAEKAAKQMALRATEMVSQSEKVGARLTTLESRIPPVAYRLLRQQWMRNHREIAETVQQLLNPSLGPDQRNSLSARAHELEERNAEIEKVMEQYG